MSTVTCGRSRAPPTQESHPSRIPTPHLQPVSMATPGTSSRTIKTCLVPPRGSYQRCPVIDVKLSGYTRLRGHNRVIRGQSLPEVVLGTRRPDLVDQSTLNLNISSNTRIRTVTQHRRGWKYSLCLSD